MSGWIWVALTACHWKPHRGNGEVIPPEQLYLDLADQTLPTAFVGDRYDTALDISGGTTPYHFVTVAPLPGGLALTEDGHVKGLVAEAGAFTFPVAVVDSAGRSKQALISMTVVLEPTVVRCGETVDGRFLRDAIALNGRPDLTELDGLAWIAVELPDDLTTRVDLTVEAEGRTTLYVERPNEVIGSWDLDDLYVPKSIDQGYATTVSIDAGTDPSLTGFATQTLLPMVLVASGPGDWSLTADCSDGPVFTNLLNYPVEQGLEFALDYDVFGADNDGVRIWTDDELPDWIVWDESTGTVTSTSGLAEEPGTFEITVNAETRDGRTRSERSIFSVFHVTDLTCGESAPVNVSESYFDGEFYAYYDPKGYEVYRLDLTGQSPSTITLHATGSDSHYLGLSEPDPEWLNFYGGAERRYLDGEVALYVDPSTYPATHHYRDATELFFSAGSIGTDLLGVQVSVDCGFDPLPDLPALPVFEPLQPVDYQLEAIGGEPPYAWSATGLPSGLVLQRDGHLQGSTPLTGTFPVTLTVLDRNDASGSRTFDLEVGTDAACLGQPRVYCGDSISSEFTEAYYNDNGSRKSTRTFCIVPEPDRAIGLELYSDDGQYRVDIADPGIDSAGDVVDPDQSTYVAFVDRFAVEGVAIDPYSWPNVLDYDQLPVFVTLRAYDPGEFTIHFVCTP